MERGSLRCACPRARAEILDVETLGNEAMGRGRHDDRSGSNDVLRARHQAQRLSRDPSVRLHVQRAGMNEDTRGEPCVVHPRWQGSNRVGECEPGAYGTLGGIVARLGPPEVDEQAVVEGGYDMAAETGCDPGRDVPVPFDHRAPVFRIETGGECARPDEIAEE